MEEVQYIGMFIDLINSTQNAESLDQKEYVNEIIIPYQQKADEIKKLIFNEEDIICFQRGDEVFLYHFYPLDQEIELNIMFKMIEYYLLLKTSIYLLDFNYNKIDSSRPPIDIGAGMNYGKVILVEDKHIEGYSINKTKRIEGTSRSGNYYKLNVSHSIYLLLNKKHENIIVFTEKIISDGKGIADSLEVYELKEFYSNNLFENFIRLIGKDSIDNTIKKIKNIISNLKLVSPKYYWISLFYLGYQLYRYFESKDYGLINVLKEFINDNNFLNHYSFTLYLLGVISYTDENFEKAYVYYEKAYELSKLNRIKILKLMTTGELYQTNFFRDSKLIHELKKEFLEIDVENIQNSEIRKKIQDAKEILFK